MRKLLIVLLLVVVLPSLPVREPAELGEGWHRVDFANPFGAVLNAQNNTTRYYIACEYENLTVDNTAGGVGFTAAEYQSSACLSGAQSVTFTIECSGGGTACPIRMMLDGTTAVTSSVGMRADYGQSVTLYGLTSVIRFRAIREGATSAILNTQYFR